MFAYKLYLINSQYRVRIHKYHRLPLLSTLPRVSSPRSRRRLATEEDPDNNYYRQITDRTHLSRPGELTKQRKEERNRVERKREREERDTAAVIWPPVIGYIVPMN